jgi:hypothetical protein
MQICLQPGGFGGGDLCVSMLMGRSIYLHHGQSDVMAQFRCMPGGTWTLHQCAGKRNRPAPSRLVNELVTYVAANGVTVLPVYLGTALDSVLRPLAERDRDGLDDQDADDGADGLGNLAA